jgi:hypothetical protein
MSEPINKKQMLDMDQVENFFDEYDHHGSIGWLQEILNGNIDLEIMRKAIWSHSAGNTEETEKLAKDMFIVKWWEK